MALKRGRGTLRTVGATLVLADGATGQTTLTSASTATRVLTFPDITDTLVSLTATQTLTNKTLTSPTITGATLTVATLNLDDTDSAFNLLVQSTSTLTAGRTLTFDVDDASRTVRLGGNLTLGGTMTTAAAFTTSGANALTLTTTGVTGVTLPLTGTLATLAGAETFTNKTLTAPDVNGGTVDSLTSLSVRDISAAFDVTIQTASSPALTGGRALTIDVSNSSRSLKLSGDVIFGGNFTTSSQALTLSLTGSTNVTLPTTGTLATLAGSEALSNKTIGNTNTVTLKDTLFTLQDDGDATKLLAFQLSGITTGTTRTLTVPDASTTIVGTDTTQTLTNKTLTAPTVNGGAVTALTTLSLRDTSAAFNVVISATSSPALTANRGLAINLADGTKDLKLAGNLYIEADFTATGSPIVLTATGATNVTLPTTGTLATRAGTEVLTNKDFDGGTASNSLRLTVPKNTATNLTALTRKQGTILYDTTNNVMKYDDGSNLNTFGTASMASPTASGLVTSYFSTIQSAVTTVTSANYTGTTTDGFQTVLFSTGNTGRTAALPAAASNTGRVYLIKKIDSGTGTVTVDPNASETIDGATTLVLTSQYDSVQLACDGTGWYRVDAPFATGTVPGLVSTGTQTWAGTKTFSGAVLVSDGTVGAPSVAFNSDTDGSGTGIYRIGANNLGFAANGVQSGAVSSSGNWSFPAVGNHTFGSDTAASSILLQVNTASGVAGTFRIAKAGAGKLDLSVTAAGQPLLSSVANGFKFTNSTDTTVGQWTDPGAWSLGISGSAQTVAQTVNGTLVVNSGSTGTVPTFLGATANNYPTLTYNAQHTGTTKQFTRAINDTASMLALGGIVTASNAFEFHGFVSGSSSPITVSASSLLGCVSTVAAWDFGIAGVANTHTMYGRLGIQAPTGIADGTDALRLGKFSTTNTTSQVFVLFQINNAGTNSGSITANGANAATFTSTSDERVKENIVDLEPQLDNIMSLRPIEFDYKAGIEGIGEGHQIGFPAQNIQAIYPDAVNAGPGGWLQVSGWSKTEARLVKAIQELKQQFDAYVEAHP